MRRALFKLLSLLTGARAFPGAQYRAGIMPALTISYKTLPRAFLFIQILFIILSVIYLTCFYCLLTF